MSRYVGTGELVNGVYRPSPGDRALAIQVGQATVDRVAGRNRVRSGSGSGRETKLEWEVRGFLGEVAALRRFNAGPDLDSWAGNGSWRGQADYGQLEVRTTTSWQLGFPDHGKTPRDGTIMGGWIVTRKDAGRIIVCVEERLDGSYRVRGAVRADTVQRLKVPLGGILAIIGLDDVWELGVDLEELVPEPAR